MIKDELKIIPDGSFVVIRTEHPEEYMRQGERMHKRGIEGIFINPGDTVTVENLVGWAEKARSLLKKITADGRTSDLFDLQFYKDWRMETQLSVLKLLGEYPKG